MKNHYMTLNDAVAFCKELGVPRTKETLVKYAKELGIGHQIGQKRWGTWVIDQEKLRALLTGGGEHGQG